MNDPFVWVSGAKKLVVPLIILVAIEVTLETFMATLLSSGGYAITHASSPDDEAAALYALIALAKLGVLMAAGVVYFMWLFRSVKAVIAMSKLPFPFSAGMSVAYHFLPLLSLYMPYKSIVKTFDWSTPRNEPLRLKTKALILGWWLAWIGANLATFVDPRGIDPSVGVLKAGLTAMAGVLLIPIVQELPKLQEKRLQEWRAEQVAVSPDQFVEYPRYPEARV